MKILYFYQYFTTPKGAWSTRAYEFARRWVKAGDQVTIVTSVYDKSDLQPEGLIAQLEIDGIDVRVLNLRLSNKHGILLRVWTFFAYALLASWYALRLPCDVVLASSGPFTVGIPALLARYVRRKPLVFEVRDLWLEGSVQLGLLRNRWLIRLMSLFERACCRAARIVVALSDGQAAWLQKQYALAHVEVIPNASDNELVARIERELLDDKNSIDEKNAHQASDDNGTGAWRLPEWTQNKRLVLYTGTLGLIDDCGQILDVARVIQERGADEIEIAFIGDGKERAALEARKEQMQLRQVHFLGLMSKEMVARWLHGCCCSLFVVKNVPFLATASPNKLFDAFASGVPVVQTTQGWIKDLLAQEGCGITVAPGDAEAMADAVIRLTRDQDFRSTLSRNARRVAHERFDRDLLANKMRQALRHAAEHTSVLVDESDAKQSDKPGCTRAA